MLHNLDYDPRLDPVTVKHDKENHLLPERRAVYMSITALLAALVKVPKEVEAKGRLEGLSSTDFLGNIRRGIRGRRIVASPINEEVMVEKNVKKKTKAMGGDGDEGVDAMEDGDKVQSKKVKVELS